MPKLNGSNAMPESRKRVNEKDWKWFGLAGHFIYGQWCRFHLCTQVGQYLVSSVGLLVPPHKTGGSERQESEYLQKNPNGEQIGCNRFYETFVFRSGKPCNAEGCNCGQPTIDGHEIDTAIANDVATATKNHMKLCRKWAEEDSHA